MISTVLGFRPLEDITKCSGQKRFDSGFCAFIFVPIDLVFNVFPLKFGRTISLPGNLLGHEQVHYFGRAVAG